MLIIVGVVSSTPASRRKSPHTWLLFRMQQPTQSTSSRRAGHYSFCSQSDNKSDTNVAPSSSERTGRKSYKLSHNRSRNGERKEAVWPPPLEEALLDGIFAHFLFWSSNDLLSYTLGLRKYRPISKSGRPLRRFTKRNVSISDHIFRLTGSRRSAKQVGSRLQQITESSKDAESMSQSHPHIPCPLTR